MKGFLLSFFVFFTAFAINAKRIVLTSDNTVVLRSKFSAESISDLKSDILKLNSKLKNDYPIYLVLYTPGGSIQKGLEFFEFAKGINRPIHTITIFAASMGFQTIQHLDKRYVLNYGILMSHKARGGFKGEFGGGISQLDSRYGMWLRRVLMMDKLTVERTNGKQTLKSYTDSYAPELWLNGPEAVEKGYADEIAEVSCDSSLLSPESYTVKTFKGFLKTIEATFSGCPIVISPLKIEAKILTNKGYMTIEQFLNNNGKFGKDCREEATKEKETFSGKVVPAKEAQTCAYDKSLTIEKLDKVIQEKEDFLNRDLRDHVEYSY